MTDTGPQSNSDRQRVHECVRAFEQSWTPDGLRAALAHLPPPGDPLRPALLHGLVRADLREQWRYGLHASIEAYLVLYPELGTRQSIPFELIQMEFDLRQEAGEPANVAEFVERFPEHADVLRERLHVSPTRNSTPQPSPADLETVQPAPSSSPRKSLAGQELPRQFGRYRLLRLLGQGGMGAVYLGHDTQLDRPVALKVPHITSADGPEVMARFYREARAAATLHHPYICPLHDVGEIDGVPYLTMTYIEGQPLAKFVRPGQPVAQHWAADVVRRIALAMDEAHAKGVIHRDLKPANVMIDTRGEPVVMDFGVARRCSESTRITHSGGLVGTPEYMSPEQALGREEQIGPGCDIYSLGVILYKLLTSKVPFAGTIGALVTSIVRDPPPPPSTLRPDLDSRLEAICLKALAKRIEDRFGRMEDFAAALSDVLAAGDLPDEPLATLSTGLACQPGRRLAPGPSPSAVTAAPSTVLPPIHALTPNARKGLARRRPFLGILAAVLVALAGAAAGGLYFWQSLPAETQARTDTPPATRRVTFPARTPPVVPVVVTPRQHREAGLVALKAHDYARAVTEFTAALKSLEYQREETYRNRAAAYVGLNQDAEAVKDYTAALKLDPRDVQAFLGRARVRLRLKEYPSALDDCDAALGIDPPRAEAYLIRGQVLRAQERNLLALDDHSKALELKPKDPTVLAGIRDAYHEMGRSFFATRAYDQALAFFSNRLQQLEASDKPQLKAEIGRVHAQRARAYQLRNKTGDLASALHDYDAALQRNGDDAFSLANRGDVLAQNGEWQKAEDDFTRAANLDPHEFRAWYLLAHLRLQQNDVPGYRKACQSAWQHGAGTRDMSEANLLVWLCSFTPDADVNREAVLELANKVLQSKPKSYTYLNTAGAALYRGERYRDAVDRLNDAVAVHKGGIVDDWLFLALAYHRQNQPAEAQKWRDRAAKGVEAALKERPKEGVPPVSWNRRIELQRLLKEVDATLKGNKQ